MYVGTLLINSTNQQKKILKSWVNIYKLSLFIKFINQALHSAQVTPPQVSYIMSKYRIIHCFYNIIDRLELVNMQL